MAGAFNGDYCVITFSILLVPVKPGSPHLSSSETSVSTIILVMPDVDDRNGPIRCGMQLTIP